MSDYYWFVVRSSSASSERRLGRGDLQVPMSAPKCHGPGRTGSVRSGKAFYCSRQFRVIARSQRQYLYTRRAIALRPLILLVRERQIARAFCEGDGRRDKTGC